MLAGTGTHRTIISTGWDGVGQDYTSFHVAGNTGNGAPKLTIRSDGRVTVAGQVHDREIKVTATAGGADFVFADDYTLPKLQEIEAFVKKNKHLPEIPSAAEMEANGLHLAEMNIKLLQKIEELTLYLIIQQKEMELMKNEIRIIKQASTKEK